MVVFFVVNCNKCSVMLDLKDDGDCEHFYVLVDGVDVVFENYCFGVVEWFGVGYEMFFECNLWLIYVSIFGFG